MARNRAATVRKRFPHVTNPTLKKPGSISALLAAMPGPFRWMAALLVLLLFVAVLCWVRGNGQTRVALSATRELRVLKISYGTNHLFSAEPPWKQCLRAVLPTRWQQPLGRFPGRRF